MNSTNHSLVQITPNLRQNNTKISQISQIFNNDNMTPPPLRNPTNNNNNSTSLGEIHNPLLNPMPFNVQNPYLFKEFKKGLIPSNSKQNAYFANIANAELRNNNIY